MSRLLLALIALPLSFSALRAGPVDDPIFSDRFEDLVTLVLNDTGIDWCANASEYFLDCPVIGYSGQDGDYGRDALARDGMLVKIGAGAAGFDFTKLNADGNVLPASAVEWSCVRDNHTGLIWEVKVDDPSHLRHRTHTYTWYNPDPNTNGGHAGTANGGFCIDSSCDTHGFVQAVSSQGLCGANDWRMPTRMELHSLAYRGVSDPAIDSDYFPYVSTGFWVASTFWSGTAAAGNTFPAWPVVFETGSSSPAAKSNAYKVRLVRGEIKTSFAQSGLPEDECTRDGIGRSTPSRDFTVIGDGSIVRHEATGLEWQRCIYGQTWNGSSCEGSAVGANWQQALEAAAMEAGNWRLPNVNELSSIVEVCRTSPATNRNAFPNASSSRFWTASPFVDELSMTWTVWFADGSAEADFGWTTQLFRLVRDRP